MGVRPEEEEGGQARARWRGPPTDLGVRAQGHVVITKVAAMLPVEADGVQKCAGGGGLASLQHWGVGGVVSMPPSHPLTTALLGLSRL